MMYLKRATVAAVLLLAPHPAGASDLMDALGGDLFTAFGEASGYFETCRPDADRSGLRRAKVLKDWGQFFSESNVAVFSLSYDVGRLQGLTITCSDANDQLIRARVSTAMHDVRDVMVDALQRAKAK
jgi:hypothetical protein